MVKMSMAYYVYILKDLNVPFYVGYGTGNRAYSHEEYAFNGKLGYGLKRDYNPMKTRKIKKIIREGRMVEYEFIHCSSKDHATALEIELISKYGRKGLDTFGTLTNRTAGGSGGNTWEGRSIADKRKTGEKISKAVKQRYAEYGDELNARIKEVKWRKFKALPLTVQQELGNPYAIPKANRKYGDQNPAALQRKRILQMDMNGTIIKEWESAKSASLELPTSQGSISNAANGRSKTAAGFKWKWKN